MTFLAIFCDFKSDLLNIAIDGMFIKWHFTNWCVCVCVFSPALVPSTCELLLFAEDMNWQSGNLKHKSNDGYSFGRSNSI